MTPSKDPCPKGFHTVTASLCVKDGAAAIEFYKKALGAEEIGRVVSPEGLITHAELRIGDSIIFLADEMGMGPKSPLTVGAVTGSLYLYVPDVDKSFQRAIEAGGKAQMPVTEMFWGDRFGGFQDPYGHMWGLATHTRDVTKDEMEEGAKQFYAQMAKAQASRKTA